MKLVKLLKENAALRKENATLLEMYDSKSAQVHRYIKEVARLENKIESLHEDNLRLEGKLSHQEAQLEYIRKQNTDLLLASRGHKPKITRLVVEEVKTGE